MDPIFIAALAALVLIAVWRIRKTYRSSRDGEAEAISRKLEELRKKRDES